jgi:hypothetical protein
MSLSKSRILFAMMNYLSYLKGDTDPDSDFDSDNCQLFPGHNTGCAAPSAASRVRGAFSGPQAWKQWTSASWF